MNPFMEIAIFPLIRNVNFEHVPKCQRSRVMEIGLQTFGQNLKELVFTGGGLLKSATKSIINGLEGLSVLELTENVIGIPRFLSTKFTMAR